MPFQSVINRYYQRMLMAKNEVEEGKEEETKCHRPDAKRIYLNKIWHMPFELWMSNKTLNCISSCYFFQFNWKQRKITLSIFMSICARKNGVPSCITVDRNTFTWSGASMIPLIASPSCISIMRSSGDLNTCKNLKEASKKHGVELQIVST